MQSIYHISFIYVGVSHTRSYTMNYPKLNVLKYKIIIPLLVFLIGTEVLCAVVYKISYTNQEQVRDKAALNAVSYADRMITDLNNGITITKSLEQIIISENGQIEHFEKVAENMMTDSIQSIQLAQGGVVTDIYPEKGNDTGKIDLINDPSRGEIARYGRDNNITVMQGPFQLKQGDVGITIRNPVYLENESGDKYFWGFTISIIRVPEIFSNSVNALEDFGYYYRLSKTLSPLTGEFTEIYSNCEEFISPVTYQFELGGCSWKLEVTPKDGWHADSQTTTVFIGGFIILFLLTGLTYALMVLQANGIILQNLSSTDNLTGLLNRNGFQEHLTKYMKKHSNEHCVCIALDIDDFKFINDLFGHSTGDKALCILADTIRSSFPKNSILCRNGGDEFCIILKNCTCKDAKAQIEAFTDMPRSFIASNQTQSFNISVGYAQYNPDDGSVEQLLIDADTALYDVKIKGKHECLEFNPNMNKKIRTPLGFALSDISENLPGAFIIYKADKKDDSILFANKEMLNLTGCSNFDELIDYTGRSFRNIIKEDEREAVEENIWKQIKALENDNNDYLSFSLKRKNGTVIPVLDHGRLINSRYYGNIFYVFIIDHDLVRKCLN